MTATVTPTGPRSRRALLAGALGGLAAWAASTAARVSPAEAAAGDPIRMGRLNKASSTETTLQTKTSGAAYLVNQIGAGAAVRGVSTTGRAVVGVAGHDGTGVFGFSPNHDGVVGQTDRGRAVAGLGGENGTGVWGQSQDFVGVYGRTVSGVAVNGLSTGSGAAIAGLATGDGIGVSGHSNGGYAGHFTGWVLVEILQDFKLPDNAFTVPAPPAGIARVFPRVAGSGKMELCVRFPTGAVQVLATEP